MFGISGTMATFSPSGRVCLTLGVFGVHRHHGNRPHPTLLKAMLSLPPTVFRTAAHPAQNGSKAWRSPISSGEPFRLENTRGTFMNSTKRESTPRAHGQALLAR